MPSYINDNGDTGEKSQWGPALGFVVLALAMLVLPPGPQQQIAAMLQGSILRPFILTQEALVQTRVRAADAGRLRLELDSITAILSDQRPLVEENTRLRSLLSLSERTGGRFRAASVIRAGTRGSRSMFMLDLGFEDGVRVNAPVFMSEGLVGVVREVRPRSAVAMDWTHPDFRVSAISYDGVTEGVVRPGRRDLRDEERLILDGTPFFARLEPGSRIVTSGRGGVFPRGLPVGTVHSLAEAEAGWRKSYWLEPAVTPGRVTHVLVALDAEAQEDLGAVFRESVLPDSVDTGLEAAGRRGGGGGR